jgi:DNA-binding NarL/FixJ family response regulator
MTIDVRVLIIEHDYFARRGLKFLIAIDPRVRLVGELDSFDQLDFNAEDLQAADIVLINARQFNTYDDLHQAVSDFHRACPQKKIVLLDVPAPENLNPRLFAHGVAGVLSKNEIRDGIASALARAFKGQLVISNSIAKFSKAWSASIKNKIYVMPPEVRFRKLSKRLYQVADLYAGGLTPLQIADELKLAPQTVRTYIKRIYEIVDASDKWQVFQRLTARQDEDEH